MKSIRSVVRYLSIFGGGGRKLALSAVATLALSFAAEATVYRAGFRQGRFWLNNQKVVPSFDQDTYAANSWDWTLSALMCNVTGDADAKGYSEVSGKEWQWQNYYGYAYDGEMWMEAGTTYTFGGNFDDGSAILVDGEVAWAQGNPGGTTSGYNNWVAPKTYTPDTTGWHTVKLLVWDWEGGKTITCGALSATMWNTNGATTAEPTSSWSKFADDGSGALFRARLADAYLRVVSARATDGGYAVTVENLAPGAVEMRLFADSADRGETTEGWASASGAVSFAAGETKEIAIDWAASAAPVYRVYLSGTDASLAHYGDFWEWSEARTFSFAPSVAAALAATTATEATVSVTCGYAESLEGSSPDIAVTAYWGAVNGGQDASAWANSKAYDPMQPATFTDTFPCEPGASCSVVFAAVIGDGEPVWSDVLTFGVSTVTVAAPARILECEEEAQSIVLTRGAGDGWQAITVNLSYTGETADFSSLPASVEFAVGETEKTLTFTMVDNDAADGDRTFVVSIAPGDNYVAGEPGSATILVVDDETAAQTCEWTGGGDGTSWDDPANWSTRAVPTQIDTALFGEGVVSRLDVTMPAAVVARLVRVASPGTVVFDKLDVTADGETALCVDEGSRLSVTVISGTGTLVKTGAGTLALTGSGNNRRTGETDIEEGVVEFGVHQSYTLGNLVVVGGAGKAATLYCTNGGGWAIDVFSGSERVVVKDKGVLDCSKNKNSNAQLRTFQSISIEKGGLFKTGAWTFTATGATARNFYFEGDVELGGDDVRAGGFQTTSGYLVVPSTRETALVWPGIYKAQCQYDGATWSHHGGRLQVEDIPGVAVDFTLSGAIANNYSWEDGIEKIGDGVARLTATTSVYGGSNGNFGKTQVRAGTLLADNASGSATGKSRVEVLAGGTLGGIGFVGGLADAANSRLTVGGNATASATVHPGTIDDETGAHVAGTLTAGSGDQSCPTAFNNYSKLAISVCERGAVDALAVCGAVSISATGSALEVAADGIETDKAKGGTYTILSATEGIAGEFASVSVPKPSWKIAYVSEDVDGESVVTRIDLTVPGSGMSVVIR